MELRENQCLIVVEDQVNVKFHNLGPSTRRKLVNQVKFEVPGAKFQPSVRLGRWDGKKSFCSIGGSTYINLIDDLLPIITNDGYELLLEDNRDKVEIKFNEVTENVFGGKTWPLGHPHEGKDITLRDYQVNAIQMYADNHHSVQEISTGAGKAQPLYSKIKTPDGWTTMGEILPGELVSTPNGESAQVVSIHPQGIKKTYRVHFEDGRYADACGDHLWEIFNEENECHLLTTDQILRKLDDGTSPHPVIRLVDPQDDTDQLVPIHPWLVGLLLDCGKYGSGIEFTTNNASIVERVESILGNNYQVDKLSGDNDYCIKWNGSGISPLEASITQMGMNSESPTTKFVPELYENLSRRQTEQLISGLVDSNGLISDQGMISISIRSETLADDITSLLWKIGAIVKNNTRISNYYHKGAKQAGELINVLHIRYHDPLLLSNYFDENLNNGLSGDLRLGIDWIEYIGEIENQCILIDSKEHLYITDNYIVTHNTIVTAALSYLVETAEIKINDKLVEQPRTLVIVPNKDLVNQTYKDYINVGLDAGVFYGDKKELGKQHTIVTWQSLNNLMKMGTIDGLDVLGTFIENVTCVIVDECHGSKAKALTELLAGPLAKIPLRWGMTGTIPEYEFESVGVKVAVGPTVSGITTKELQDSGVLSKCNINMIQFQDNANCGSYHDEVKYLLSNVKRMKKMAEMIQDISKTGNTLVVVDRIDAGKYLEELLPGSVFISGSNNSQQRVTEYERINDEDYATVIATSGIVAVGINIPRIFNLVMIEPGKSFIKVIQTIGRGVRKAKDKDHVEVWDFCSKMKYSKRHLAKRKAFYKQKEFPHKMTKITF